MRALSTVVLMAALPAASLLAQKPGAVAPSPQAQPASSGDPYVGTFVASDLIITLRRAPQGYAGMAQSSGGQYPVVARILNGVLTGTYVDNGVQRTFQALVQGDVMQLQADGTQFMLQRQAGAANGQMGPAGQMGQAPPGGGQMAATPQDQQVAQLLMSSRWCSFAYSQVSGRTSTEQVQFFRDGTVTQSAQSETQSSNPNGSYYGNSQGGNRAYWRIQGGQLVLSQDGQQWVPQPLQVTRNSNGYPIINSGGKEYSQCN